MRIFLLLIALFLQTSAFSFSIIQKPIIFDDTRKKLTLEYIKAHYGIDTDSIVIKPTMIVLHWTELATLKESFDEFYPTHLGSNRADIASSGELNTSVPYLVDRDGTIYQLMPDNWMARHVIGLNYSSIGIENVGGVNSIDDLTEAQAESDAYLVRMLQKKYPDIKYLIGHYEYLNYKNTPLWLEKDSNYHTDKKDPGKDFVDKVKKYSGWN